MHFIMYLSVFIQGLHLSISVQLFSPKFTTFFSKWQLFSPNHGFVPWYSPIRGPNAGPDLSYPRNVPIFNHETEIWRRWSSGRPQNRTWHFDTRFSSKIRNIQYFSPNHTTFFSKTYKNFLQNIQNFSPKHTKFFSRIQKTGGANLRLSTLVDR